MLKQTLWALAAAAVSTVALAEPSCMVYPKNEQIAPAKFQEQLKQQGYQIKKFKETKGNCYEIYGRNKAGKKV